MKTEKEKMLAGELYLASDPELVTLRLHARKLCKQFNDSHADQNEIRADILRELLASSGENLQIEPPFYCDYGFNIQVGNRVYFNFDCVVLDVAEVIIGSDTMFGPKVQIYTATHPLDKELRCSGLESARPITIGDGVWVGGGAILCPGVEIGSGTVIGAGSVVTKDIPPGVLAVGNPCRILRGLT